MVKSKYIQKERKRDRMRDTEIKRDRHRATACPGPQFHIYTLGDSYVYHNTAKLRQIISLAKKKLFILHFDFFIYSMNED